jgi:glutamate-1-semialdehyde 2,1-aminomutase
MTLFFTDTPVVDYATAKTSDVRRYAAFFRALLERNVYFAPSQFEAAFQSTAHGDLEIETTAQVVAEALHVVA